MTVIIYLIIIVIIKLIFTIIYTHKSLLKLIQNTMENICKLENRDKLLKISNKPILGFIANSVTKIT